MTINKNNSTIPIGVTYTVTNPNNPQGPSHFLIGTIHIIDLKTLHNPCFRQTVEKCSILFTEYGTHYHLNSKDGSFVETLEHDIPYPRSLDAFLMTTAWCKGIPIRSLDEHVPEMQEIYNAIDTLRKDLGADAYDKYILDDKKTSQETGDPYTGVQCFTEGDLDYLAKVRQRILNAPKERVPIKVKREIPSTITAYLDDFTPIATRKEKIHVERHLPLPKGDVLITKREEKWAEILIPQLLKADKPIGIAVGCAHVVGKDSLSERFARAGLKIELITPSRRSRL